MPSRALSALVGSLLLFQPAVHAAWPKRASARAGALPVIAIALPTIPVGLVPTGIPSVNTSLDTATVLTRAAQHTLGGSVRQTATATASKHGSALGRNAAFLGNGNDRGDDQSKTSLALAIHQHAKAKGFIFELTQAEIEATTFASAPGPLEPTSREESSRKVPPAPDPSRRPTRAFFASLLIAQLGVEALGLAVPQLAGRLAVDHQTAALLPAFSFGALTLGSLAAGPILDRIGIRRAYLGMFAARLAAGTALAATYGAHALTFPLLTALFAVDYLFLGASRVAESVVSTAIHGSAHGKVAGFGTIQQMVIEAMGIVGLTAGVTLLAASGFGAALWLYPGVVAVSGALVYARLRPLSSEAKTAEPGLLAAAGAALRALRGNAAMKRAVAGYGIVTALVAWVYFTIAPKFGLVAPGLGAEGGAYWISVLFAAGGLLATIAMAARDARAARAGAPADGRAELLARASRWTGGLGLALLGALAFALPSVAGALPALAFMAVFGFAAAGALVTLEAVIKTEAPAELRGGVMGVVRAAALLSAALSFPLLGLLFDLMPASWAFGTIAGLLAAIGGALLALRRGP